MVETGFLHACGGPPTANGSVGETRGIDDIRVVVDPFGIEVPVDFGYFQLVNIYEDANAKVLRLQRD